MDGMCDLAEVCVLFHHWTLSTLLLETAMLKRWRQLINESVKFTVTYLCHACLMAEFEGL